MIWAKTVRYQKGISLNGKVYNVLCENDSEGVYALYVDREYVTDLEALPTEAELKKHIREVNKINNIAEKAFIGDF